MMTARTLNLTALFALVSCGSDEAPTPQPQPTPIATTTPAPAPTPSIPRLAAGPHFGMITGFDPLNAERAEVAERYHNEARANGASIGRIQIDWSDLESAPGNYDADGLAEAFADPALEGMNVVVLVSTLDSDGLTLPEHLSDGEGLRNGLTVASPEVTGAFTRFLDWLGPQLMARNVWAVSFGNEVDSPVVDGLVAEGDAIAFYETGLDHWNTRFPEIATTVTLTIGAIDRQPSLQKRLRDAADLVTFNYYCLDAELTVTGRAAWRRDLATMKTAAGTRDIFIQELGCPVGYGTQGRASFIGGSPQNQADFFAYFGEVFANDPQMRAATMFQLYDWSPELAGMFGQMVRDEGEQVAGDRLEEWAATSGFLRWSDNGERPAWATWQEQLRRLREARGS